VRTAADGGGDGSGGATVEFEIPCCSKKDMFRLLPVIFIVLVVANVYIVYHRGILGSVHPYQRAPRRTLDQQIQELLADDPAQAVDSPKVHPYHKADHAHADPLDLAAAAGNIANANDEGGRAPKRPILAPNPIHDPVAQVAGGNGGSGGGVGGAVDLKLKAASASLDLHVRGDGELNNDVAAGAFTGHGSPYCLDTLQHSEGQSPGTYACHGQGGSQAWQHRGAEGSIVNSASNLCIGTKGACVCDAPPEAALALRFFALLSPAPPRRPSSSSSFYSSSSSCSSSPAASCLLLCRSGLLLSF
jgi:hypothetical protein